MFWIFLSFIFSKLKVSETSVRLPNKSPYESTTPYAIITCYAPNVNFDTKNAGILQINTVPSDSRTTKLNISVIYDGSESFDEVILKTHDGQSANIQVFISPIDEIKIEAIAERLHVDSYYRFKLKGYSNGCVFTSLNGTALEWGSSDDKDHLPFITPLFETTPFKAEYEQLPNYITVIKPIKEAETDLTCKLSHRPNVKQATHRLHLFNPIVFVPETLYMIQGSKIKLNISYGCDDPNMHTIAKKGGEIDFSNNEKVKKYRFESSKSAVAEVDEYTAVVSALTVGQTTITVKDTSNPIVAAQVNIYVQNPNSGEWEEQWIKPQSENKGNNKGPFEPDYTTMKLFYNKQRLITPDTYKPTLSDEWKQPGTHKITATFPDTDFTLSEVAHTCPSPKINPSSVLLPLDTKHYVFVIRGGSGDFNLEYDTQKLKVSRKPVSRFEGDDGYMYTNYSIEVLSEGQSTIEVSDLHFEDYHTQLSVTAAKLTSLELILNETEIYLDDNVEGYEIIGKDIHNHQFDAIENFRIDSSDRSIINSNLRGVGIGFTQLQAISGDIQSPKKWISVYKHLDVLTVSGLPKISTKFVWSNGPLQWGDKEPSVSVTCKGIVPRLSDDYQNITFDNLYSGDCQLRVANPKTANNTNPRPDTFTFGVTTRDINYVLLHATDPDAVTVPSCNVLRSEIQETEVPASNERTVYIPYNHLINLEMYAYSDQNERLCLYNVEGTQIMVNDGHSTTPYTQPFRVHNDLSVTATVDSVRVISLKVIVIHPIEIDIPTPIVLYNKNKDGIDINILKGSQQFSVIGDPRLDIKTSENVIHSYPSSKVNPSRTVTINDICVSDGSYSFEIHTESIANVNVSGPTTGSVNTQLQYEISLIGSDGNRISPESLQQVNWKIISPENHEFNKDTGILTFTPTKAGIEEIHVVADDIRGSLPVQIYDKMQFALSNQTLLVGDRKFLKLNGNPGLSKIVIESSDPEIITIEDGQVAVCKAPGVVQVTARFKDDNNIEPTYATIRVLRALDLLLTVDVKENTNLFVGSYAHVIPHIQTDSSDPEFKFIPATTVTWNIKGNNNWEKLYDNSIIIQGDKEGAVTVKGSIPQKFTKTVTIDFDERLKLLTPEHVKIPIGSTFDIKVVNNLPVKYQLNKLEGDSGNFVDENNTLHAKAKGRFILIVTYKQQWQAVPVTITEPVKLFLQSEAAQVLKPRVLDPDYQEYTPFNGGKVTFNTTYTYVNYDGQYSFSASATNNDPILIQSNCSIEPSWQVTHYALLFPRNRIHPTSPIIQKGAKLQLICQAPKPQFRSLTPQVASVTSSGLVTANSEGRAIIYCTDDIETRVTVVTFESVSLLKVNETSYRIHIHYAPPNVAGMSLNLAEDMTYKCSWDADECGYSEMVEENGQRYCRLNKYAKKYCPEHSVLEVNVQSIDTDLNLSSFSDVYIKSESFDMTSTVTIQITKGQRRSHFDVGPSITDNITYSCPEKMRLHPKPNSKSIYILDFDEDFEKGTVVFEDQYRGERLKLHIRSGSTSWSTRYLYLSHEKFDNLIFFVSMVLTIGMAIFVYLNLRPSQRLPPFSPYNLNQGHHKLN